MVAIEAISAKTANETVEIRIKGIVQGVGFRPAVLRIANEYALTGHVLNDAQGVLIQANGTCDNVQKFCLHLKRDAPRLSRIDSIDLKPAPLNMVHCDEFRIVESEAGDTRTHIVPDAALCSQCSDEIIDPSQRRFRYPFANCTHCGPRFSIIEDMPYDRTHTTMSSFLMCDDCLEEYTNPRNRRFHAQPIACNKCGPHVSLECLNEEAKIAEDPGMQDDIERVADLLKNGMIVAIRSIGGFHLACDATNIESVRRLRKRKKRDAKPFALMARDIDVINRFCSPSAEETELLHSLEAPIVLLNANGPETLPEDIAPGLNTLGFMLPFTPIHVLLLQDFSQPLVMTSGNISEEPQITDNDEGRQYLKQIADYALFHNRNIANRIDDSVTCLMAGKPTMLRRSRGYVPGSLPLPKGFEKSPPLTAMGGELKTTFCIIKDGAAILSQHQGDLKNAATFEEYQKNLKHYEKLFDHSPEIIVVDQHPEYLSGKIGKDTATENNLSLSTVQHHHAHIASCMCENGIPLNDAPVLGVVLDGAGFGDDGSVWGGEFLLADYCSYQRLGTFKPVAMIGGDKAVQEPWRNTYAHIVAGMGWPCFADKYKALELFRFLEKKPLSLLDRMLEKDINIPLASSCGRLFDAVAAAIGLARDKALFEGQGAMLLEAQVMQDTLCKNNRDSFYPFEISNITDNGLPCIRPLPMWQALFQDLMSGTPTSIIAARFHKGMALAVTDMVSKITGQKDRTNRITNRIVLTGGCFQNKILTELVYDILQSNGFDVLTHSQIPPNDGGLALGQAIIGTARTIQAEGE